MKNAWLFCCFIALVISAQNAQAQSCCTPQNMADYQLLASSKEFKRAHEEPLPFRFVSANGGESVQFDAPDGKKANGWLIKAKKGTKKYLFVYQEWWGLNDYIKQEAEKYYTSLDSNVNVLAIDLYDGMVATTREDAGKYMQAANETRLENIIKGALAFVGKKAKVASVGWCFGGGWSLRSALLSGKQAVGCIMYYGKPVKDVAKLKTLKTVVLGLFAGQEKWISKEVVAQFEKDMTAAGKKVKVKSFDAEHAFANPSNPKYDKAATAEAFALSLAYLKERF